MSKKSRENRVAGGNTGANSTRLVILSCANRLITEVGMSDFRIDMLSAELSLSPGNVTYHFPKKEDIANALWSEVIHNVSASFANYYTPILDIKQLFLFLRGLFIENYSYRGVIAYKLGDISVLSRSMEAFGKETFPEIKTTFADIIGILQRNGYLNKSEKEEAYSALSAALFFWFCVDESLFPQKETSINQMGEDYAIAILYPLINIMTEKGMVQYDDITHISKKTASK